MINLIFNLSKICVCIFGILCFNSILIPTTYATSLIQNTPDSVFVSNQIIVKFNNKFTISAQDLFERKVLFDMALGVDPGAIHSPPYGLDALNVKYKVLSYELLIANNNSVSSSNPNHTYLVKLDASVDSQAAARDFAKNPFVDYSEVMSAEQLNNNTYGRPQVTAILNVESTSWAINKIGAPFAWGMSKGKGVVIAVIDTGININHVDLKNHFYINSQEIPGDNLDNDRNGYVDDVSGWNFENNNNMPLSSPSSSHGTEVAAMIVQVAPDAKILPIFAKLTGANYDYDIYEAFMYAINQKVNIINFSFYPTLTPLIMEAFKLAHNAGITVVYPAGNANSDIDSTLFKKFPSEVIVVAGVDKLDHKSDTSNFGTRVDVSAPAWGVPTIDGRDSYATSFAAPIVSGVAALVLSASPFLNDRDIKRILKETADVYDSNVPKDYIGTGRVNAYKALVYSKKFNFASLSPMENKSFSKKSGIIEISGSIYGDSIQKYQLSFARGNNSITWVPITNYIDSKSKYGKLGNWKIDNLISDIYWLKLEIVDFNGKKFEDKVPVYIEGDFQKAAELGGEAINNQNINNEYLLSPYFTKIYNNKFDRLSLSKDQLVVTDVRSDERQINRITMYDLSKLDSAGKEIKKGVIVSPANIMNGNIVWIENNTSKEELHWINNAGQESTLVSSDLLDERSEALITNGGFIVYGRLEQGNRKLYGRHINSDNEFFIKDNVVFQEDRIAVDGDKIVWSQPGGDDGLSLNIYDLNTKQLIIVDEFRSLKNIDYAIDGRYLVVSGDGKGMIGSIKKIILYDFINKNQRVIQELNKMSSNFDLRDLKIRNNRVVWSDNHEGNYNIYLYDLNDLSRGVRTIVSDEGDQYGVVMDDGQLAWIDARFNIYRVYTQKLVETKILLADAHITANGPSNFNLNDSLQFDVQVINNALTGSQSIGGALSITIKSDKGFNKTLTVNINDLAPTKLLVFNNFDFDSVKLTDPGTYSLEVKMVTNQVQLNDQNDTAKVNFTVKDNRKVLAKIIGIVYDNNSNRLSGVSIKSDSGSVYPVDQMGRFEIPIFVPGVCKMEVLNHSQYLTKSIAVNAIEESTYQFTFRPGKDSMVVTTTHTTIDGKPFNGTPEQTTAAPKPNLSAVMTFPLVNGNPLPETVTFTWKEQAAKNYDHHLTISTKEPGLRNDFKEIPTGYGTSATVSGLPQDGKPLYVRLWTKAGDEWLYNDYTYYTTVKDVGGLARASETQTTVASGNVNSNTENVNNISLAAEVISPATKPDLSAVMTFPLVNGNPLPETVTFTWKEQAAKNYDHHLTISTKEPSLRNDFKEIPTGYGTSATVSGLPQDGKPLYVRLWTKAGDEWLHNDYTYYTTVKDVGGLARASETQTTVFNVNVVNSNTDSVNNISLAARVISPAENQKLTLIQKFVIQQTGNNLYEHHLTISKKEPGKRNDLFEIPMGYGTSITVYNIPQDGQPVYVRLWTKAGNEWLYKDYTYKTDG